MTNDKILDLCRKKSKSKTTNPKLVIISAENSSNFSDDQKLKPREMPKNDEDLSTWETIEENLENYQKQKSTAMSQNDLSDDVITKISFSDEKMTSDSCSAELFTIMQQEKNTIINFETNENLNVTVFVI